MLAAMHRCPTPFTRSMVWCAPAPQPSLSWHHSGAIDDDRDTVAALAAVHMLGRIPGPGADIELAALVLDGAPGFEAHAAWATTGRPVRTGAGGSPVRRGRPRRHARLPRPGHTRTMGYASPPVGADRPGIRLGPSHRSRRAPLSHRDDRAPAEPGATLALERIATDRREESLRPCRRHLRLHRAHLRTDATRRHAAGAFG